MKWTLLCGEYGCLPECLCGDVYSTNHYAVRHLFKHFHYAMSLKMFTPSSSSYDLTNLCFNKAHFTRSDFDGLRFMSLARRRSNLKTVHSDLRLYLKSIQHSMVELINEDYAHFVHLSSNLVALKSSVHAVHDNTEGIWKEFNGTAKNAVAQAEAVEGKCTQLADNREGQNKIRRQISATVAVKRLHSTLKNMGSHLSIISIDALSSLVVDVTENSSAISRDSPAHNLLLRTLDNLEQFLTTSIVESLAGDGTLLPSLFSIASLCSLSHRLVSRVVSDVVSPSMPDPSSHEPLPLLQETLKRTDELRSSWAASFDAALPLIHFLERCLLTHLLTVMESVSGGRGSGEGGSIVDLPPPHHFTITLPLGLRPHVFLPRHNASYVGAFRGRFQLQVYFLQVSSPTWKSLQHMATPSVYDSSWDAKKEGNDGMSEHSLFAATLLKAIDHLWSDSVFLSPLAGKSWEQTCKMLSLFLSTLRSPSNELTAEGSDFDLVWRSLLGRERDATTVGQKVFDLALEAIWPRLREVSVDTSIFGQTMHAFVAALESEAKKLEAKRLEVLTADMAFILKGVGQLPKMYRWTKKPMPTGASPYMEAAMERIRKVVDQATDCDGDAEQMGRRAAEGAVPSFLAAAEEVLEGVEATGSALSRLKRRQGTGTEGESDEEKIRVQIGLDLTAFRRLLSDDAVEAVEAVKVLQKKISSR